MQSKGAKKNLSFEEKLSRKIETDRNFRIELTKQSFPWFFTVYFSRYITCEPAPFHLELELALEDNKEDEILVFGFPGSAKSVIVTTAFVIWSIVSGKRHFPIITSQTAPQVRLHMQNIRSELEENELLIADFGSFSPKDSPDVARGGADEWNKSMFIIPRYDAAITGVSVGQRVRGMRYRRYRPDLIIGDDVEDIQSVQTKELRDKTYRWWKGTMIPRGVPGITKTVLVGNLLHQDSLLKRVEKDMLSERRGRIFKFALTDPSVWAGRFPTPDSVNELKQRIKDPVIWAREYLLKIIPDSGQIVTEEHIHYYDDMPVLHVKGQDGESDGEEQDKVDFLYAHSWVDLAISERSTADCTAMVSLKVFIINGKPKIYILPKVVNQRLDFAGILRTTKEQSLYAGDGFLSLMYIEDVAFQKAAVQAIQAEGVPAEGVPVAGRGDKRARLLTVSHLIHNGTVVFPRKGAEELIIQLLGFGTEEHDDMVDALVGALLKCIDNGFSETLEVIKLL